MARARQTCEIEPVRTSTVEHLPDDPVGICAASALAGIFRGARVELVYSPDDAPLPLRGDGVATTSVVGDGPPGWRVTCTLRLTERIAKLVSPDSRQVLRLFHALPGAALRAASQLRGRPGAESGGISPSLRRALRDTIVIELLGDYAGSPDRPSTTHLIAETLEYLIELSGTRVESHELTHGVIITDAIRDTPRLRFDYPAHLRAAKRAPLLFDGQRALLVVDRDGHARSELQRHRLNERFPGGGGRPGRSALLDRGSFVAEATRRLGGVGFYLRSDRTIWVFVDGQPLVLRRSEHWTAFPLELTSFIADLIGGGEATGIVVQAALNVSAEGRGAILAIVGDASVLDPIVSPKDRFDLRNDFDPAAIRTETRLHHLIDGEDLDDQTLSRLAGLDGATIVDRDANLLAYGAIVTSSDSEHEGARTAAAKSLSHTADIVLKVSEDGDITVFHEGEVITQLLGGGLDR
ncbi:MAG TPA: diadenylate cyclase [Acidimicrobiia bacterium]